MRTACFALLLCLLLGGCGAEAPRPDAEEIARAAAPLISLLSACADFQSFDGAPDAALARQAVNAYRQSIATAGEAETDARAYSQIFAYGEYPNGETTDKETDSLPCRMAVESAIMSGAGEVIATVRAECDYGSGWELNCYFDIYLAPDHSARYGARVTKVFLPE